ncbi:MAG: hypothetical protein RR954_08370 [Christensenellaceae bacterium]
MKKMKLVSSRNECVSELSSSVRSLPFYPKLSDDEKMVQMTKSVSIPKLALVRPRKTTTMNQLHDIA